jgi:hypothetical protein
VQLEQELQSIAAEYNRLQREASRNPERVKALEDERAAKENAAYARYDRLIGVGK